MERIEFYRQCIRNLLIKEATLDERNPNVESQLVFDTEHDHYQLIDIGWEELRRIYNCFIHIDIKDGKIWIQHNMTDVDLAEKLVDMGVTKKEIVLGLHPPYKRPHTGYGVG